LLIDIFGISFDEERINLLSEALIGNNKVSKLFLSQCSFGPDLTRTLMFTLQRCSVLELFLGGNTIGNDGAIVIADALRTNSPLRKLDLYDNDISDDGIIALRDGLYCNCNLIELLLSNFECPNPSLKGNQKDILQLLDFNRSLAESLWGIFKFAISQFLMNLEVDVIRWILWFVRRLLKIEFNESRKFGFITTDSLTELLTELF